jgi:hypothetical protein
MTLKSRTITHDTMTDNPKKLINLEILEQKIERSDNLGPAYI